ncbi:unnamed protein product [Urochloa humidicola]
MVSSSAHQETAPASDAGALLPLAPDATSEVLLRLPGKSLCRLRAVCRAWRSLLSAPWFVAAHAAHNREPYLFAGRAGGGSLECEGGLVDPPPSGRIVVKPPPRGKQDAELSGRFRLLDQGSGSAVHRLWRKLEEERAARGSSLREYREPVYLFGPVTAGAGERKVLRMLPSRWNRSRKDLVEVCTLRGSSSPVPAEWRPKQGFPQPVVWHSSTRVVIGGVAYFLSVPAFSSIMNPQVIKQQQGWVARFDLEAEEWRPDIRGPGDLLDGHRVPEWFFGDFSWVNALYGPMVSDGLREGAMGQAI